jgi:hypothetical protein
MWPRTPRGRNCRESAQQQWKAVPLIHDFFPFFAADSELFRAGNSADFETPFE